MADLILVRKAFGLKQGDPDWKDYYDLDGDGVISLADLILVRKNFT